MLVRERRFAGYVIAQSDDEAVRVIVFSSADPLGFCAGADVRALVLSRARHAAETGCDGVISSGLEAPAIRAEFGTRLLVVTPGIRPARRPFFT